MIILNIIEAISYYIGISVFLYSIKELQFRKILIILLPITYTIFSILLMCFSENIDIIFIFRKLQ